MQTQTINVEIELVTEMLGTVPKNKEVYASYIESKRPAESGDGEAEVDTVEEIEEKGWTGFHSNGCGLFVYDYFIKGFLKNAANVLKDDMKMTAFRSKVNDYLFVEPRMIPLGHDKPAGVIERPLRAQTAQGPRVCLARSDYVPAGTVIKFKLLYLANPKFKPADVKSILEYGRLQGLGQFRNGGYGRFKVLKFEFEK
jgi:hypothetical protein